MFSIPYPIIQSHVALALAEDIGNGDVTANVIPARKQSTATLICRESAILCGQDWFNEVFKQLGEQARNKISIDWKCSDGSAIAAEQVVCVLSGEAQTLLTGERTAMNFLQTLSGTATITASYARLLKDSTVKLLDTRKTIPGLRAAQKYAVRCGGGYNHRLGLFDGVLIKENHILAAGSITHAIISARENAPHTLKIEVEIETLDELREALQAGADILLLDNMDHMMLAQAVKINNYQALLEVSGNITAETISSYVQLGIDYISTGAITKHLKATDFSLRFD
jgi:nicotinate-nucleotide pyrophosphorylase (carboxylating)